MTTAVSSLSSKRSHCDVCTPVSYSQCDLDGPFIFARLGLKQTRA